MEKNKPILVTGCAGFIGYHLAHRLLQEGYEVVGLDNLNDYYDVNLKNARLALLKANSCFRFIKVDLADREALAKVFKETTFPIVLHMAAQAGVRYSLVNPYSYLNSNLVGFLNILEGCRNEGIKHLIFASSSSVYGANAKTPFSISDNVDHPISFYGATKRANELMAHSYAHLYGIPCTGLRFFTVYGPWGRPDMAPFIFTRAILKGEVLNIFNHGKMRRDFTYIDDIVKGVLRVAAKIPGPNPASGGPYHLYNIGNHQPVNLLEFIEILEEALGKKAEKRFLPLQKGDMLETFADVDDLVNDVGFRPKTSVQEGLRKFVTWYREFYGTREVKL